MEFRRYLFFGCLLLFLSSCAFDGRFHRSDKIPLAFEKITFFNFGVDTTYLNYDKKTKEVNLLDSKKESRHENYTIKNDFFTSSSGNKLQFWTLTPKSKKPLATILHFHGAGGNLLSQYKAIAPLVNLGYKVFTFDYSGYGVSEGKATRENALKDAYSALDYVRNQNEFSNGQQLVIYGQSYGGYLAAIVGAANQEKISGMVIEGAFSSHRAEAKHMTSFFGNLVKNDQIAAKEIKKNYKPVLIIHSTEDTVVPFKFGKTLYENANEPKMFYEIDKGHVLGLQYKAEEISNKIVKLIISSQSKNK